MSPALIALLVTAGVVGVAALAAPARRRPRPLKLASDTTSPERLLSTLSPAPLARVVQWILAGSPITTDKAGGLLSPTGITLTQLGAGKLTIDGHSVNAFEARAWIFEQLWRFVAVGAAPFGQGTPNDPILKALRAPGTIINAREIIAIALAWELSPLGPSRGVPSAIYRRLADRAQQVIDGGAHCAVLGSQALPNVPWGAAMVWTMGNPSTCQGLRNGWRASLQALLKQSLPADQKINLLAGFIASVATFRAELTNWQPGAIPRNKAEKMIAELGSIDILATLAAVAAAIAAVAATVATFGAAAVAAGIITGVTAAVVSSAAATAGVVATTATTVATTTETVRDL